MNIRFIEIFWIAIITSIIFALVEFIPSAGGGSSVDIDSQFEISRSSSKGKDWIQCSNSAGCIGKVLAEWPACPICNTAILHPNPKEDSKNIAEDIFTISEEIYSLDKYISEIKIKREEDLQKKLADAKTYDVVYANTVRRNLLTLRAAYFRTKKFVQDGGEQIEGSLISGYYAGKPVWKKAEEFQVYPRKPH